MKCCFLACLAGLLISGGFAAEFQNLNFDEANTNNVIDGFLGSREDLLPGWRLFSGRREVTQGRLNLLPIGYDLAILYDRVRGPDAGAFVEGRFSLTLIPGREEQGNVEIPYTLLQTGQVPEEARSIHFLSFFGPVEMSINGSRQHLFYNSSGLPPGVVKASADLSLFSGETVELQFRTSSTAGATGYGLESIVFSPEIIPEVPPWALMVLGGLGIFGLNRVRRKQKEKD
jgi:hypothetical protein